MEKSIETKLKKQVFFGNLIFRVTNFQDFHAIFSIPAGSQKIVRNFDFAKGDFPKGICRKKNFKSLAFANACTTEFPGRYVLRKLPYISEQF